MPRWTMRPCSITRISSARRTVASRCAMMIDVRPAQQRVERLLDQDLARAVDVRGRLVEDQDARVGEQRARDRDQLALAGGEPGAALADDVVEPAPRSARRRGRRRSPQRPRRPPRRSRRAAEADVVGDRAAEQERVLEDDSELPPVASAAGRRGGRCRRRAPRPRVGVVEAGDQLRGRRLAAARLADERDAAARRHVDRDAVDDRLVAVGERRRRRARAGRRSGRSRRAPGRSVMSCSASSTVEIFVHRRARRLHLAVELRELLQRLEDELQHARRRRSACRSRASRRRSAARRRRGRRRSRRRRGTRSPGRRPTRASARRRSRPGSPR